MRETTSLRVFLVYCLKVAYMSGNGCSHLRVLPRSPWVPTMQSQSHLGETSEWRGSQRVYVRRDEKLIDKTGGNAGALEGAFCALLAVYYLCSALWAYTLAYF